MPTRLTFINKKGKWFQYSKLCYIMGTNMIEARIFVLKGSEKGEIIMSMIEIGCCGAYCKTCRALSDKTCHGCKLGYQNGDRDINKAKCKIKVCCLKKSYHSCADCKDIISCQIVNEFYSKNGDKYRKYKQATDYIRKDGYDKFLSIADHWKNAYGKYNQDN